MVALPTAAQPTIDARSLKVAGEQRTVGGILALLDVARPDPARVEAYRKVLAKPLPPPDAFWFTRRNALIDRMDAAEWLGDTRTLLECAHAIMEIFRSRQDEPREMEFAMSYAGMLRDAGQDAEAHRIEEQASRHPQTYAHWVMTYHNRRTIQAARQGNVSTAQEHYGAAATEYQRVPAYASTPNTASGYYITTAWMRQAQGRWAEAEASYQLALKETEKWVANMGWIAGSARHALPSTRGYSAYLAYRLDYADFLRDQGRLLDAQRVALQPLLWSLQRVGKYSPHAVRAAASYAAVLVSQGRAIEAEQLARASVEMAQGIGAPEESLFMRDARNALARALLAQQRVAEADTLFQIELKANPQALTPLSGAAAVLNGRGGQVLAALGRLAQLRSANLGENSPLTGEALGVYAMALQSQGQMDAALAAFQAALPALRAARRQAGESEDALRLRLRQWILEAYLEALGEQAGLNPGQPGERGAAAMTQGFVVADLLRAGGTQQAVSASAARAAARDPQQASTARREQDLRSELVALYRTLQQVAGLTPKELEARGIDPAKLRDRVDTVTREHEGLFAEMERRFPKYAELIDPKPPTVEQLRNSLRSGEALVSIISTPRATLVWAVGGDKAAFHISRLGEPQIAPLVKSLRAALDVSDLPYRQWPELDLAVTYRLYKEFIEPVQAALEGAKTLVFATSQSLGGLPLAVLTTAPHALGADSSRLFDRYASAPWLDKRFATAYVPSVSALVSLRAAPASKGQRNPFTGFGDPVFTSQAAGAAVQGLASTPTRAAPLAARAASDLNAAPGLRAAAMQRPDQQTLRNAQAASFVPYSQLNPLPDTRDEVLALARALGADPARHVLLGAEVTKAAVKQRDLSKSRVIAFATHGLLAGDFPGLNQPALALSPPPGVSADAQPLEALLTLEDVMGLVLDADWVVLSACNTAAADGQGTEAVSGLGRGFFYAGSRAMLVTHWAVETESARDLVNATFSRYAQQEGSTRAHALQHAMQEVRHSQLKGADTQGVSWAHPLFWAPYALVGEPGR